MRRRDYTKNPQKNLNELLIDDFDDVKRIRVGHKRSYSYKKNNVIDDNDDDKSFNARRRRREKRVGFESLDNVKDDKSYYRTENKFFNSTLKQPPLPHKKKSQTQSFESHKDRNRSLSQIKKVRDQLYKEYSSNTLPIQNTNYRKVLAEKIDLFEKNENDKKKENNFIKDTKKKLCPNNNYKRNVKNSYDKENAKNSYDKENDSSKFIFLLNELEILKKQFEHEKEKRVRVTKELQETKEKYLKAQTEHKIEMEKVEAKLKLSRMNNRKIIEFVKSLQLGLKRVESSYKRNLEDFEEKTEDLDKFFKNRDFLDDDSDKNVNRKYHSNKFGKENVMVQNSQDAVTFREYQTRQSLKKDNSKDSNLKFTHKTNIGTNYHGNKIIERIPKDYRKHKHSRPKSTQKVLR